MNLNRIRKKIDFIDIEIVKLLKKRLEHTLKTKKLKNTITDSKREAEVIKNVLKHSHHPIDETFSTNIFSHIISECKRIQNLDIKIVGFLENHGNFGEVAIKQIESKLNNFVPIPYLEFTSLLEDIENNNLDLGVVPIENSLEESSAQVINLLIEKNLIIIGEINIPITHCLLTLPNTNYQDIRIVYAHPQTLAQCRKFLLRNNLEPRPCYETFNKILTPKNVPSAAIGSKICADLYNLKIIQENIGDYKSNYTRFIVLSKEPINNGNKCSIVFVTEHKSGSLSSILKLFDDENINLTRIESIPLKKNT